MHGPFPRYGPLIFLVILFTFPASAKTASSFLPLSKVGKGREERKGGRYPIVLHITGCQEDAIFQPAARARGSSLAWKKRRKRRRRRWSV